MNVERDSGSRRLRCAVATVSISEVRQSLDAIVEEHFSKVEAEDLASRHPRTTAGALAAKEALCQLFGEMGEGARFSPRDFVVGHDEKGAPAILERPVITGRDHSLQELWISISHTRDLAYGLAMSAEVLGG